jgi:ribosomal protein L29
MNRRRLLQLGVGTGLALAMAASTIAWVRSPAGSDRTLDAPARAVFAALADVMLDGSLPTDAEARRSAIDRHLQRVEQTVAGLPPHVRAELARLLTLLDSRVGRWVLMGMGTGWTAMQPDELAAALENMRRSSLRLRQQVYQALRELTMASYFTEPDTWRRLGYPGPLSI